MVLAKLAQNHLFFVLTLIFMFQNIFLQRLFFYQIIGPLLCTQGHQATFLQCLDTRDLMVKSNILVATFCDNK